MMTKFDVIITPKADRDLAEIEEYLSQFYTRTPKKFLEEFNKKLERLSFSPWHKRLDNDSNYRRIYFGNRNKYVIIYIVDEDTNTVRVHRVFNSKRDFSRVENIEVMEERAVYHYAKNVAEREYEAAPVLTL